MTYETVIEELLVWLPEISDWDRDHSHWLDEHRDLPYVIFGCLLIPMLEDALAEGRLGTIVRTCAFVEQASIDSGADATLEGLICIEIGEWLGGVAHEEKLAPWLGVETKRICGYVPGLATQRRADRETREQKKIRSRLQALWIRWKAG